jgi:hypothetical protein
MNNIYNILVQISSRPIFNRFFLHFYKTIFFIIKQVLEKSLPFHIQCWYRHSLRFNAINPLLSDIDLTITLQDCDYIPQNWQLIQERLKLLKKVFPILGETNIYNIAHLKQFSSFANTYEVKRDPDLLEKFHIASFSQDTLSQSIIFLIRGLSSDYERVEKYPIYRIKKWNIFYNILDLNSSFSKNNPVSVAKIIHQIQHLLPNQVTFDATEFKQIVQLGSNLAKFGMTKCIRIYFPHLWPYATANGQYREDFHEEVIKYQKDNTSEQAITLAQLNWEFWGVITQIPNSMIINDVVFHLEQIKTISDQLNVQGSEELSSNILYLVDYLSEWGFKNIFSIPNE